MLTTTNPATTVNTVTPTPCQTPSEFQIFNFESSQVRVVIIDGEPWFVGKDVGEALGYGNTRDALANHVEDEDKQILLRSQNAALELPNRGLTIINESGMFDLIMGSKLPTAKAFKRWLISEVLPTLRKTGQYSFCDDYLIEDKIQRAYRWIEEEQKKEALRLEAQKQKEQIAAINESSMYNLA